MLRLRAWRVALGLRFSESPRLGSFSKLLDTSKGPLGSEGLSCAQDIGSGYGVCFGLSLACLAARSAARAWASSPRVGSLCKNFREMSGQNS